MSITSETQMTDTTLTAESEEESEKAGSKLNIQNTKIRASSPITSWQIDGETMVTARDYSLGLPNPCSW